MSLSPRPSRSFLFLLLSTFLFFIYSSPSTHDPFSPRLFFVGPRNSRARPPRCKRIQSARARRSVHAGVGHVRAALFARDAFMGRASRPLLSSFPSLASRQVLSFHRRLTSRTNFSHLAIAPGSSRLDENRVKSKSGGVEQKRIALNPTSRKSDLRKYNIVYKYTCYCINIQI